MIQIQRNAIATYFKLPNCATQETVDIADHAIATYSFLIPIGSQITWKEFCKLILAYSSSDRTKSIIRTIMHNVYNPLMEQVS